MLIFSDPPFYCPKFSSCGPPPWDTQHIDRGRSSRFGRVLPVWSKTANVQRPPSNVQHRTIGEGSGWLRSSVQGWKLSVGRWTFVLAFLPTYPSLPAFACLYRYHTRLSVALSCLPYSLVKRFDSWITLKRSGRQAPQRACGGIHTPLRAAAGPGMCKKTRASTIRACVHICAEIFVQFDPLKRHNTLVKEDIKIFHNSGTPHFECID